MMRRAVRLTLLVLFLAATGLTAYLFWLAEQQAQRASSAARGFDEAARAAIATAGELRSAQQAYVAPGQGPDFWFGRSHALQSNLKSRVSALRAQAGSSAAVTPLEDALGILQDFEQMDFRAREFARAVVERLGSRPATLKPASYAKAAAAPAAASSARSPTDRTARRRTKR